VTEHPVSFVTLRVDTLTINVAACITKELSALLRDSRRTDVVKKQPEAFGVDISTCEDCCGSAARPAQYPGSARALPLTKRRGVTGVNTISSELQLIRERK
jgi:hypothetical protein